MSKLFQVIAVSLPVLLFITCSKWEYAKLSEIPVERNVASSRDCAGCHEENYVSWKKNKHGDPSRMKKISVHELQECGACHTGLEGHADNPNSIVPVKIEKLNKTEQNRLCGKCHYNRELFGRKAINPHDRHGLFLSYGFEGYNRQISCLECHQGHNGKKDMLRNIRAHTCFRCHKEAIVTMGVFQPINYVAFGKVCVSCHPVHGGPAPEQAGRMTAGALATCLVCHPTGNLSKVGF